MLMRTFHGCWIEEWKYFKFMVITTAAKSKILKKEDNQIISNSEDDIYELSSIKPRRIYKVNFFFED